MYPEILTIVAELQIEIPAGPGQPEQEQFRNLAMKVVQAGSWQQ